MSKKAETALAAKRPRATTGRVERTQALRNAIIDSAIKEFAAKGYSGASLRVIAGRTGIELGHLGYHFSTKMELWQAAVAALFDAMPRADAIPRATNAAEASANVGRLIVEYASFCITHPEHIQIVFGESAAGGERLDWVARHYLDDTVAGLTRHIEAAHEFGVITNLPASVFIAAMVGMSAINFALPPLRDILLGGGLDMNTMQTLLGRLLPTAPDGGE